VFLKRNPSLSVVRIPFNLLMASSLHLYVLPLATETGARGSPGAAAASASPVAATQASSAQILQLEEFSQFGPVRYSSQSI